MKSMLGYFIILQAIKLSKQSHSLSFLLGEKTSDLYRLDYLIILPGQK